MGGSKFSGLIQDRSIFMSGLFEISINEKQTIAKARKLLEQYHRIKRVAMQEVYQPLTAQITPIPTGKVKNQNSSKIEIGVQRKLEATDTLQAIDQAIHVLSDKDKHRITAKFMSGTQTFDYEIYNTENISQSTYYRQLHEALLNFAECYKGGQLLVLN